MKLRLFVLALLVSSTEAFVPQKVAFTRHLSLDASKLERLPESSVKVTLSIPGSSTKAAFDKVCNELSKTITLPGFRKGSKIPPAVLENAMAGKGGRYALRTQAIQELLGELIEPALKEDHGLEPIGQPTLEQDSEEVAKNFKPGEDLELDVLCDVWPDIEWKEIEGQEKPYFGLKGKYTRKPFNDEKFNKAINDLLERYAELAPITDKDHEMQMGDACIVNMEGWMANEAGEKGEKLPDAASGDNVEVILGTGRYMTGLVEGLVGAKVGETKEIKVTFPEALKDKTLAGKAAIFDVTVAEAKTRTLPELTDEFAEKVRAGLTVESLKEELRKAVDSEDSKEFRPARNAAIAKALAEVMDVEVPDTLVTKQAREKFAMMMTDMRNSGVPDEEIKNQIKPENFLKYKKIVKDDIVRDFKVSMATDEIGRMEGVEVPDYQVEEQMESIRQEAAESKEDFDETQIRSRVEATLQREAVMDLLAENSNFEVEFAGEEEFDAELMEKLAAESLAREQEAAGESAAIDVA
ncbi:unnamed protein product [Cylindrotheca closterium]|uniref:peptidylprolyl isomerase n=1 Tax=Cylindrotheca closterium TaxID=2856 RepID=A0AAD2GCT5_9STRA|nr:unnamed protein product [Cylindrotheca closterium]